MHTGAGTFPKVVYGSARIEARRVERMGFGEGHPAPLSTS